MSEKAGRAFAKLAFTPAVKAVQEKLDSRESMARMETTGQSRDVLDDNLIRFVTSRTSLYFGTANAAGEPYIQHRGGEPGFVGVEDDRTLVFRDYPGNKQYISMGNLSENEHSFIFMIDYENKTRVKFWGTARVIDMQGPNRAIRFRIRAWDINCSKHLPDYFSLETVRTATAKYVNRIAELEAEVAELRAAANIS